MTEQNAPTNADDQATSASESSETKVLSVWDRVNDLPQELKIEILKKNFEDGKSGTLDFLRTAPEFHGSSASHAWKHVNLNLDVTRSDKMPSILPVENRRSVRHVICSSPRLYLYEPIAPAHEHGIFPVTFTMIWPGLMPKSREGMMMRPPSALHEDADPNDVVPQPVPWMIGIVHHMLLKSIDPADGRCLSTEEDRKMLNAEGQMKIPGVLGQFLDNPRLRVYTIRTVNPADHDEVWWEFTAQRLDPKKGGKPMEEDKRFSVTESKKLHDGDWLEGIRLKSEQVDKKPWEFLVSIGHVKDLPNRDDWILIHVKEDKVADAAAASSSAP